MKGSDCYKIWEVSVIDLNQDLHSDLTRKAINFDLDTKKLKEVYPKAYTNAYYDIREYLEDIGYKHRQGSGYISVFEKTIPKASQDLINMGNTFSWLKSCIKRVD